MEPLHVTGYGGPDGPPLVIAHGLFGSGRNWAGLARRLSDRRRVLAVDLRNHGQSFREDSHSYDDLAGDLVRVIEATGGPADVLGHSMGGKAAMVLALRRPDLVRRLIVADIAPVGYRRTQQPLIDAMRAAGADHPSRAAAEAALAAHVADPGVRGFLLHNLDLKEKRWRVNLDALEGAMGGIMGFPAIDGRFEGPVLFLTGAESDYVRPEHGAEISRLFPGARTLAVPGAGHWLHADRPGEVEAAIRGFLGG